MPVSDADTTTATAGDSPQQAAEAEVRRHPAVRVLLSWPVRLLVTAALLGVVAVSIDWSSLWDRLQGGSWGWFVAAVLILMVGLVIAALRWSLLLEGAGVTHPRLDTVRAFFVGAFSNNVLPTAFGGDVARTAMVGSGDMTRAATSVAVDRLSSIACLIALGTVAALFQPGDVPHELRVSMLAVAVAVVLALAALAGILRSRRIAALVPQRLRPVAGVAAATLRAYSGNRRLVVGALVLGLLYQAITIVEGVWLARAIDLDLSASLLAVAVPLVTALTLFPVSVAGFGVREGGFVALLGTANIDSGSATALSLLTVAAMALASLPGAFGLLTARPRTSR
jgi:uncharacterized protein (TIRG00374 family)